MSVKTTLAAIRAMRLSVRHTDGEWRVTYPLHVIEPGYELDTYTRADKIARAEDFAHYTDCAQDAIGTARVMADNLAERGGVIS